jgi:hypothetical protein
MRSRADRDRIRDLEVCVRRLGVSGGVVVIEHHGGGVMVEDRSHQLVGTRQHVGGLGHFELRRLS